MTSSVPDSFSMDDLSKMLEDAPQEEELHAENCACNDDKDSEFSPERIESIAQEALELAISTWGDYKPLVHYSESRTLEEEGVKPQAHSDYIYSEINTYGHSLDIEVEAKMKELTVLDYISNFGKHPKEHSMGKA